MVTTPTNDAPVPVKQCDREAAARLAEWLTAAQQERKGMPLWFVSDAPRAFRAGAFDSHEFVQSHARHRLAALASAPAGGGVLEQIAEIIADHVSGPNIAQGHADAASHRADQLAAARAILAALARPRAAVGEREEIEKLREAVTRLLPYAEIEAAKAPTTDGRVKRMLAARKDRDHARAILALQSPRAKVEG